VYEYQLVVSKRSGRRDGAGRSGAERGGARRCGTGRGAAERPSKGKVLHVRFDGIASKHEHLGRLVGRQVGPTLMQDDNQQMRTVKRQKTRV
jgi:hypothetical protein